MTPDDVKRLWEEAKANGRALDGCVGPHDFVDQTPEKKLDKKYRCALCGGKADSQARHWYTLGLAHAAKAAKEQP